MLKIRSNGKYITAPSERVQGKDGFDMVQGKVVETPVPAQFDGFMWPVDGIVVPDDFLTEIKLGAYLQTPILTVEWRERKNQPWKPYGDHLRELEAAGRAAGPSPASGPAHGPDVSAIQQARERGIHVGGTRNIIDHTTYMLQDGRETVKSATCCQDCGGMLNMGAVSAGHTTHATAGEVCPHPIEGGTQDFMMPPRDDG